jgi:anti-anti-sigma regulatory factor
MPLPELRVDLLGDGGAALVGVLDLFTIDAFDSGVAELENAGDDVALDLSRLTFLDSTGLGAIVRFAGRLGGRRLRILGATGTVRATLLIAGIDGRRGIEVDVGEA